MLVALRPATPLPSSFLIVMILCAAIARGSETTRIVSLLPSFTEIAYELRAEKLIVGVSDYCRFPAEAQEKPHVGGFLNPSMERILSLKPSVVVLSTANADLGEKLRKLNVDVRLYPTDSLEDVFALLRASGSLLGQPKRAEQYEQEWRNCLNGLRRDTAALSHPRTLIVVSRQSASLKDIYAATSASYLGQLAEYAGATNVITRRERSYATVSLEEILTADPEVILDFSLGEFATNASALGQHLAAWDQLPTIAAVRSKRIYPVSDPHATIPGPSLCATAQLMANLLHRDSQTTNATERK